MDTLLQILSMAFALFLLMDPLGNVPIYIAVLKDIPVKRQKKIIFREMIIALVTIILFAYVGESLLNFLHVQLPTILISGGIILFLIALKMIFPIGQEEHEYPKEKEPFIVPLAIPLVAGPAVLAAVMLYSGQISREFGSSWRLVGAIFIAWITSTLILLASTKLKKIMGQKGLIACERLMGLLLTLIAVQMFLEGLGLFLKIH